MFSLAIPGNRCQFPLVARGTKGIRSRRWTIQSKMPLSELEIKWSGMDFNVAAEEVRRLKEEPLEREKLVLYGLYKQAIHGDIPPVEIYPRPSDEIGQKKFQAWANQKGKSEGKSRAEYVKYAEEMIRKYKRKIVRCKWNSQVWSVDY